MNPFPLLAAGDQIVTLIIFAVLAAASSWLTKRRQQAEAREAETPPPTPPVGESGDVVDPHEIFRRILRGETAPPRVPPPLPGEPASENPPPPLWEEPEPFPTPPPPPPRRVTVPERPKAAAPLRRPAPSLGHASASGARASARPAPNRSAPGQPTARRTGGGGRWASLLRDRSVAKQAFLEAQIFGPPKSLER